jgi:hypothetical protein
LEEFVTLVIDNKEWLFSGVGILVLTLVGRLIFKKASVSSKQIIRSGDSSKNVQAGRDFIIKTKKKGKDVE